MQYNPAFRRNISAKMARFPETLCTISWSGSGSERVEFRSASVGRSSTFQFHFCQVFLNLLQVSVARFFRYKTRKNVISPSPPLLKSPLQPARRALPGQLQEPGSPRALLRYTCSPLGVLCSTDSKYKVVSVKYKQAWLR